jgi:hypothetical protein
MTFDVEIMLRGDPRVYADRFEHDREPGTWTERDADALLRHVLRAIDRTLDRGAASSELSLRGLNWIVNPYGDGVVLALEIHSASAVAGPFRIERERLSDLLARAIVQAETRQTVH